MIASDEPWVRAPVVSPGAWNRSASIRMQRCSISAVRGYSAWSMKFRCKFSAISRCASGSIQVVTNVAKLRAGSPSRARSSATSRIASTGVMPVSGKARLGTSCVAKRFPNRTASTFGSDGFDMWLSFGGGSRSRDMGQRKSGDGSASSVAEARHAGNISIAPMRKHKAPSSVPATATRVLSTSSERGST